MKSKRISGFILGAIAVLLLTTIAFAGGTGLYNMYNKGPYMPTIDKYVFVKPMTQEQQKFVDAEVDAILEEIVTNDMDTATKVKKVHHYMVENLYFTTTTNDKTPYDALAFGKTDSISNARLMALMLDELNVKNKIITGKAKPIYHSYDLRPQAHAWNLVKIEGKWYHFDVSYDTAYYTHDAFCGTTDKVLEEKGYEWHESLPKSANKPLFVDYEAEKVDYKRTRDLVDNYKTALDLVSFYMSNPSGSALQILNDTVNTLPEYPEKEAFVKLVEGFRYFEKAKVSFKVEDYR